MRINDVHLVTAIICAILAAVLYRSSEELKNAEIQKRLRPQDVAELKKVSADAPLPTGSKREAASAVSKPANLEHLLPTRSITVEANRMVYPLLKTTDDGKKALEANKRGYINKVYRFYLSYLAQSKPDIRQQVIETLVIDESRNFQKLREVLNEVDFKEFEDFTKILPFAKAFDELDYETRFGDAAISGDTFLRLARLLAETGSGAEFSKDSFKPFPDQFLRGAMALLTPPQLEKLMETQRKRLGFEKSREEVRNILAHQ
jgi:hypothetical protein